MKHLFTTLCLGATVLAANAGAPSKGVIVESLSAVKPELSLKTTNLSNSQEIINSEKKARLYRAEQAKELARYQLPVDVSKAPMKAPRKLTGADINGKSYVVKYLEGTSTCNGGTTVAIDKDSITFYGLANGYDVKGTFDATKATATIPCGQVLGTHSTYGKITLATATSTGAITTEGSITATFTENGFALDNYLVGRVTAGNLILMNQATGSLANAKLTMYQNANVFSTPLSVKKTSNSQITIVGISSLLYGAYEEVPFKLDTVASTLTLPFGTTVDVQTTSTSTTNWTLGGYTDDNKLTNLTLAVKVAGGKSTATTPKAFLGYEKTAGTGSYSGYAFTNVSVDIDFDILAAIEEPAPETSNDYVVLFNDGYDDLNEGISIVAGEKEGEVVIEGLAQGFDVTGTYDSKTKTITIPTGVVIGNSETYGDITLRAINGEKLTNDPITITFDNDTIKFNYGIGGTIFYQNKDQAYVVMTDPVGYKANGYLEMSQSPNVFRAPLLITKVSDTKLSVVGISNLLYNAYYDVNFKLDATAKTVTLPWPTQVDNQYKSTGYVAWYLGGYTTGLTDLVLNLSTTDNSSSMTAAEARLVYLNGTSYSGYKFTDVKIYADYNVITAEDTGETITDTPEIDGIIYKIDFDTKLATVTGALASCTNLNVPATFVYNNATYTVTAVAETAFWNNKTVTAVSLPATVKTVGTDAFRNMSNLKEVNIPDLKAWCKIVFTNGNANPIYNVFPTTTSKWGSVKVNGKAVTTLEIPEGVDSIGRSFYGFKALTAITLPTSLRVMGDQSLSGCTSLTEVVIPEGVTTMGTVFYGCTGLKKVTLPSTLTKFTSYTFSGCSALESIELPAGITELPLMLFYGCKGLKSITSLNTTPPSVRTMAFDGVDTTIPVYVPAGSVEAYKAADGWKEFTNIQAIAGSSVSEIEASDVEAVYYDLNGRRVNGELVPGIYVRVKGAKADKVIVK